MSKIMNNTSINEVIRQPSPPGFIYFEYKRDYHLNFSQQAVADWLNRPETFSKGQIPPFKVEFLSKDTNIQKPGFQEGTYTNHHGPLLSANGVLTKIERLHYRDLQYFYGSYVLSFRLIRPTRLQFWIESKGSKECVLRMQLDSWVRPWFRRFYKWGLDFFFTSFHGMARSGISKMLSS